MEFVRLTGEEKFIDGKRYGRAIVKDPVTGELRVGGFVRIDEVGRAVAEDGKGCIVYGRSVQPDDIKSEEEIKARDEKLKLEQQEKATLKSYDIVDAFKDALAPFRNRKPRWNGAAPRAAKKLARKALHAPVQTMKIATVAVAAFVAGAATRTANFVRNFLAIKNRNHTHTP